MPRPAASIAGLDAHGEPAFQRATAKGKYRNAQGDEDVKHMKKMLSWTYVLYAIGESDRARRAREAHTGSAA